MRRAARRVPELATYVVPVSQAPAPCIHVTEPVRPLVALGFSLVLSTVAIDLVLSGRLTFFFDLCFVSICLLLGLRAAEGTFYTAAILPPLLMLVTCTLLALVAPTMIADPGDGAVQAVVSGLAHHALTLAVGYALCLVALQVRVRRLSALEP